MIRGLIVLLLLASPVMAAEWRHFVDARFGFGLDIPPGFVDRGTSSGGGEVFGTPVATLTVSGSGLARGDFEAEVRRMHNRDAASGWVVTYQATTPDSAGYSARKGARVREARLIAICGDTALAMFTLDYGIVDLAAFEPVVARLQRSLAGGAC